jgi:hypothetical protein
MLISKNTVTHHTLLSLHDVGCGLVHSIKKASSAASSSAYFALTYVLLEQRSQHKVELVL